MRRTITMALIAGVLSALGLVSQAPASAQSTAQDLPPQEPGVTLRVFDLGGVSLDQLCTLRDGQTPNVDTLMPTIDFSGESDFGIADTFVSHTIANLTVPVDGAYTFRLTSDDGSRLSIDGEVVVDHDGGHPADPPKEGSVTLTAGVHELFIEHFERAGDEQLTLEWSPPGTDGFEIVPTTALSTEADVVRVTAPGTKYCVQATDSPGDGLQLNAVHPNYDLTDLRPDGFEPMVSAMAWTDDEQLLVATAGQLRCDQLPCGDGDDAPDYETGELYLLGNVTGDTSPADVTATLVADRLMNPMGVVVADGTIYVSERDGLTELTPDTDGDGLLEQETIATWPFGGNHHEFAFGLLYEDGSFYVNLSVAISNGGQTNDPQPAENRGTTIKVDRDTGEVSYIAGGLRTPNGMTQAPGGGLFVLDNQGQWLPSSKLVHIEQDRFFNHRTNPPGPFDDQPVTRPVLWLPQNEISNSPSAPLMLDEGPFAGQMVFGDVTYGGLQRAYLEQVDDEYQGAVFRHSAGLEAGVNRTLLGPDGAIYVGGIGERGNWGQPGKLKYGLQKLTPNGTNAFDIREMRATEDGFELEYTQPLSADTAADLAAAYQVQQWTYSPSPRYGGPKVGTEELPVAGATLSADGTTVTLEIDGLKRNRVIHVRSPRPFTSVDGEQLWNTEAWYTLNEFPGDQPEPTFHEAETGVLDGGAGIGTEHAGFSGDGYVDDLDQLHAGTSFAVEVDEAGDYDLGIRYANGSSAGDGDASMSIRVNGEFVRQSALPPTLEWDLWATQRERVRLGAGVNHVEIEVGPDDTGQVNLDALSVRPAGERIQLLGADGDLSEWQHANGRTPEWPVVDDGVVEVCCGDLRTKEAFGDYRLHVEFWLPEYPPDVTGQARANSGVYMQERYEIQVLDSFGIDPLQDNDAAAIYNFKAADVNAATPPETWQTYDIVFREARFDPSGQKVENARVTVEWNGQMVQDDVEIPGTTGPAFREGPATGPIHLQDHRNPVRYRNVWIEPLYNAAPDLTAGAEPTSGEVPLEVEFSAQASDPEGTDVTYEWDFGEAGAPTPTTPDATHTYTTPGRYDARVTAVDADGQRRTRHFTIDVDPYCPGVVAPSDEFDGNQLDPCRWNDIVREDPDHYRLADGHLEIDALNGDMQGGTTNASNVVLQDAPDVDTWEAITHFTLPEGETYEQAGIILHTDDNNFAKLVLIDNPTFGWVAAFSQTLDGRIIRDPDLGDRSGPLPDGINTDGVWLRLARDGDALTAEWSADGATWTTFGPTRSVSSMTDLRVGLAAYNGAGQPAAFDFFRIDDGLPADTTGPELTVAGIEDGSTHGASEVAEVSASATDSQSGLDRLDVALDGESLAEGGSPQSVSLELWALELGDHVLEVTAVDVAGNPTVERIGFTVDTSIADVLAHLERFERDGTLTHRAARHVAIPVGVAQRLLDQQQPEAVRRLLQRAIDEAADVGDPAARDLLTRDLEHLINELG